MSDRESKSKSLKKLEKGLKNLSAEEQQRIRSLLKDKDSRTEEQDVEKVDWLYKESKPEQEDYLLGRRVDKYVEQSASRQVAVKDIPGSTFKVEDDELIAKRADLDMQAKMREDPLFAIRKKEEEAKRRLLENPMKMKQLQKIISLRESEKKKKKKEKKQKKHKKHKSRHHDSSSSDSGDDDLVNKYLQILSKKHRLDDPEVKARLKRSVEEENEEHSHNRKDKHQGRHDAGRDGHRQRHDSYSSDDEGDRETDRHRHRREDDEDKPRKQYGLVMSSRYKSQMKTKTDHRSRSPRRSRSPQRSRTPVNRRKSQSPSRLSKSHKDGRPSKDVPKKKLSAEEKERLRLEMMNDAKARDEQRESNVKRYREEDRREQENQEKHASGGKAKFISSMMTDHVTKSSVEDRIKRNKYNVQRTKAAMENSFRKK